MLTAVVVCPSVCPSDCRKRHCTKTAIHRIRQTTPYDSTKTLVFWRQRSRRISDWFIPTVAPNRKGVGSNKRHATNISLYLKTVQDRDIVTMNRYNRNSCALYRMALFLVTSSAPIYPNHSIFDILYRLSYLRSEWWLRVQYKGCS